MMNSKVAAQLKLNRQPVDHLRVRFGNGNPQPIHESALAVTELGGNKIPHAFLLTDSLPYDILLGIPYLKAASIVISFSPTDIKLNANNQLADILPINSVELEPRRYRACLSSSVIIKAGSSSKVELKTPRIDYGECVFTPRSDAQTKFGIYLSPCVVEIVKGAFFIYIENYSPSTIFLPKKACLGDIAIGEDDRFSCEPVNLVATDKQDEQPVDFLEEVDINPNLLVEDRKQLSAVLTKHRLVFAKDISGMKICSVTEHTIELEEGTRPIRLSPYKLNQTQREKVEAEIMKMLKYNIIRPSQSPFSFPLVVVSKPDGSIRLCVDFRKLNQVTRKDSHPLPSIEVLLQSLTGSNYFSTMDMINGYYQVQLRECDKKYTAFGSPLGLHEFNVMPFGLCNAPATFQRMVLNVLGHLINRGVACYLDDVVIYSKTIKEHASILDQALTALDNANLRLKTSKCHFAYQEVALLGFIVNQYGLKADPAKVRAVVDFPPLLTRKHVRSFIGLASYYRIFIEGFASIAAPLNGLLKEDQKFQWTEECERAFNELKSKLTNSPCLIHFSDQHEIHLGTDASTFGLGACLSLYINKKERPAAFISRSLLKHEKNYSASELEMLCVVWAVKKFRHLLYGRPFVIITDHCALCYLRSLKNPESKLARWSLSLSEYDFTVQYKKGKKHTNCDSLSRFPVDEPTPSDYEYGIPAICSASLEINMREAQSHDDYCQQITEQLLSNQSQPSQEKTKFFLKDGVLFRKLWSEFGETDLIVLPKALLPIILRELHEHHLVGHGGAARTYARVKSRFFRPNLRDEVIQYVRSCIDCQKRKDVNHKPYGMLGTPDHPLHLYESVHIDIVGPLPVSIDGNKYIICLVERTTRFLDTGAFPEVTAQVCAQFVLDRVVFKHGVMRSLTSDRGSQFTASLFKEMLHLLTTKHKMTASYHPQSNGVVERANRVVKTILSIYVQNNPTNWCRFLQAATFAINTSVSASTGYPAYYLLYLSMPSLPIDKTLNIQQQRNIFYNAALIANKIRHEARERLINQHLKNKKIYDVKHMEHTFAIGDLVLKNVAVGKVGNKKKLGEKWAGPMKIIDKYADSTFRVYNLDPTADKRYLYDTVAASRLKHFVERELASEPTVRNPREVTGVSGATIITDHNSQSTRVAPHQSDTSSNTEIYDAEAEFQRLYGQPSQPEIRRSERLRDIPSKSFSYR